MLRAMAPDKAIAEALVAASRETQMGLQLSGNIFRGPELEPLDASGGHQAVPRECIFVLTTGGEQPIPTHDGVIEMAASATIRVRSEAHCFEAGQELARDIWFTVHQQDLGHGYIDCQCTESEPRYLGRDDLGHHRWDITVRTVRTELL